MLDTPQKSKLKSKAVASATAIAATALLVPGGIPLLVGYYLYRQTNRHLKGPSV